MTPMSRMDFSPASHTDAMQLGDRSDAPAAATDGRLYPFVSVLSVKSVACHAGVSTEGVNLFLLFLAEFLESGIGAQRVPDRIEPKKGRRNGRVVNQAVVGRL